MNATTTTEVINQDRRRLLVTVATGIAVATREEPELFSAEMRTAFRSLRQAS